MFKKLFKKLSLPIVAGLFIAGIVSAQIGGFSPIGSPTFWRLDSGALQPVDSTYEIGSSSSRIAKIWATDGDFSTLTFGGVASGDIDMAGNDILNVDQIKGNSQAVHIGTGTPTNAAGEGALYVQSAIETDLGFFSADGTGHVLGDGTDAALMFSVADANANVPYLGVPTGDATNSSTIVVGELADATTDLGFFDGETEPGIALLNSAGDRYVDWRWDGTYFEFGSGGAAQQYRFSPTLNLNQTILARDTLFQVGDSNALTFKRNFLFGDDDIRFSFLTHPIVMSATANVNSDFGKGVHTRPTLYLTSETAFTTSKDEYIKFEHDTNDAVFTTGTGNFIFTPAGGQLIVPAGSAGTPSIGIAGETNSGFFGDAAGSVYFTTGGIVRVTVNSGGIVSSAKIRTPDGTEAAPMYTFSSDADTGVYSAGANELGFTAGGTLRFYISETTTVSVNRFSTSQGADVASANNLVLGNDGNTFEITGTTQINCIEATGWEAGSTITLWFTSTPTVKHNQTCTGDNLEMLLDAASDYAPGAGDGISLQLSEIGGTEVWRSVGIHNL